MSPGRDERSRGSRPARSRRAAAAIDVGVRGLVLTLLWLTVTGLDPGGFAYGAGGVLLSLALSVYLLPPPQPRPSLLPALRFIARVAAGMAVSGLGVARRALRPARPVTAPGFLHHPMKTATETETIGLSYALSLMPGTAGARFEKEGLEIHALDREGLETARIEEPLREIGAAIEQRRAAWRR